MKSSAHGSYQELAPHREAGVHVLQIRMLAARGATVQSAASPNRVQRMPTVKCDVHFVEHIRYVCAAALGCVSVLLLF
jgi:hypothetical protein